MPLMLRTSSTMLHSEQQCNLPSLLSTLSPLFRLLRNEIQNPKNSISSPPLLQIHSFVPFRSFRFAASMKIRDVRVWEGQGMILAVVVMPMIAYSN